MKEIFKTPITPQLSQISLEIHPDIHRLLKERSPQAKYLYEDPELEQLYYAWILIRSKSFKFSEKDNHALHYISVEIKK